MFTQSKNSENAKKAKKFLMMYFLRISKRKRIDEESLISSKEKLASVMRKITNKQR